MRKSRLLNVKYASKHSLQPELPDVKKINNCVCGNKMYAIRQLVGFKISGCSTRSCINEKPIITLMNWEEI